MPFVLAGAERGHPLIRDLSNFLRLTFITIPFEAGLKDDIEAIECVLDAGGDTLPASRFELGDRQGQLEFQSFLRLEAAAPVAARDFELVIDGLVYVGCGQRALDVIRVVEGGQIVIVLFPNFADEGGVAGFKTVAKVPRTGLPPHYSGPPGGREGAG